MIERWILTDDVTHEVMPDGYASQKEAWAAQVDLARKTGRSPYEWTAHKVTFDVR